MDTQEELVARHNKKYGPGTLVRGDQLRRLELPRVTTGSLSFDRMLGGGWPLNQWNEIIGNESQGKTVLALKTIAANQADNPDYQVLWVASEEWVGEWSLKLGIDPKRVILAETNIMEDAFEIILDFIDNQAVDAVVLDSYPALVPASEDEKAMVDWQQGLGARLMGKFMRKSNTAQRRSLIHEERDCLALIINQWREKIGIVYGDPRTTPGGKAKNFSYFTRVEVARDSWIEDMNKAKVGLTIKARTTKNKTAPNQRTGQVDFYFDDTPGFAAGEYDTVKEVFTLAVAHDIIVRGGAFYKYGETRWKGKDEVLVALRSEPDLAADISAQVLAIN